VISASTHASKRFSNSDDGVERIHKSKVYLDYLQPRVVKFRPLVVIHLVQWIGGIFRLVRKNQ
jgi:hypothetical protein